MTGETRVPGGQGEPLTNNVHGCALVFEGGGYRGAYTAGMVNLLLERGIHFDYACGISAGSSHTINYVSRDQTRVHMAFLAIDGAESVGGFGSFLRGRGYFNAELDRIAQMEREGRALVIRPDTMPVSNGTLDTAELQRAYVMGHEQLEREMPHLLEFVDLV